MSDSEQCSNRLELDLISLYSMLILRQLKCLIMCFQLDSSYDSSYLVFRSPRLTWFRPTTLQELLNLKAQYPDAKIVTGNTEVGMEYVVNICMGI